MHYFSESFGVINAHLIDAVKSHLVELIQCFSIDQIPDSVDIQYEVEIPLSLLIVELSHYMVETLIKSYGGAEFLHSYNQNYCQLKSKHDKFIFTYL